MFANIIHFPPIKAGKDAEFHEWFAWSNQEYAKHKGFISRKLLKRAKAATMRRLWSTRALKLSGPCTLAHSSRSSQTYQALVGWRAHTPVL